MVKYSQRGVWRQVFVAMSGGLTTLALLIAGGAARGADDAHDTDGDGLSDFHEQHKYRTDPAVHDSDRDGVDDGDWAERREYAYSIRTVVKVMPPISMEIMCSDYQDARELSRGAGYVELEVIHYPSNSVASAVRPNPRWRSEYAAMTAYLDPGPTTNWDDAMWKDLLAALRDDDIDIDKLTDEETVEKVSAWALSRVDSINSSAYAIQFRDGKPQVLPVFVEKFREIMQNPTGSIDEQFERELYGRGMYYRRTMGSCTSAANYLTTCLRAVGIPTRTVRVIPLVDASDLRQVAFVEEGIHDQAARDTILKALKGLGESFTAHTFNEVYVGRHWHRLNYTRLGQNILDEQYLGLMTHVQTYSDLAEAGVADTWGAWQLGSIREEPFLYSNPYRATEVADLSGPHRTME